MKMRREKTTKLSLKEVCICAVAMMCFTLRLTIFANVSSRVVDAAHRLCCCCLFIKPTLPVVV